MDGANISARGDYGNIPVNYSIVCGDSDFNGDGKSDILWRGMLDGQTTLWLMNGTQISQRGNFGQIPTTLSIVDARGDFNADGINEILWHNDATNEVVMWYMNGAGTPSAYDVFFAEGDWYIMKNKLQIVNAHGDYNNDGMTDILWRDASNGDVIASIMYGPHILARNTVGNMPLSQTIVDSTDDFNGDGMSDILWRGTDGSTTLWQMYGPYLAGQSSLGTVPTEFKVTNDSGTGMTVQGAASLVSGTDGDDTFHVGYVSRGAIYTGGSGADTFIIDDGNQGGWVNFGTHTITDFVHGIDSFIFKDSLAHLGVGPLPSNKLVISNTAQSDIGSTQSPILGYSNQSGDLYYAERDSGGTVHVNSIATLTYHPQISASDFLVVP
jgi:hypothetical protein